MKRVFGTILCLLSCMLYGEPSGADLYCPWSSVVHLRRYPSEYCPEQWHTIMLHMRSVIPMPAHDYRTVTHFLMGDCFGAPAPTFNTVFSGDIHLDYITNFETPTGYTGNNGFAFSAAPLWLVRYQDCFLMKAKALASDLGINPQFFLRYFTLSYFLNDWVTLEAGKFQYPLGAWWIWYSKAWIRKLVSDPLIRSFLPANAIAPDVTIGVEAKGAIPIYCWGPSPFISYDVWVGNGPSEENGAPDFGEPRVPDNNNGKAYGGRLAFWPNLCGEIAISGMRGRWNNNRAPAPFSNQKLYYNAACVDWNWHFSANTIFRGEYLWTQYDSGLGAEITQQGFWAQLSFFVSDVICTCGCFWEAIELAVRGEGLWTDLPNRNRRRVALGGSYYFTQTASLKCEYDINLGERGFGHNQFFTRVVFAW